MKKVKNPAEGLRLLGQGACCLLLLACSGQHTTQPTVQIPVLTDSLRQVVGLATVENKPYTDYLTLNGQIACDPNNMAHIFPMFGGTVIKMNASVGDYVKKGQILAVVHSGEVADYSKQMNDAELQILSAEREKSAMHDMYAGGMASNRELLQAEKALKNAHAEKQRLQDIYEINHITGPSTYAIVAPISGFVTAANINPDMQIRSDQDEELFSIAKLDNVWVIANVYEKDISRVNAGDSAQVTTLTYGDDKVFKGKVDKVYPVLEPESKTEDLKINLPNPDYRLKPGMFANVNVRVGNSRTALPAVPSESVVFDDGKSYLIVVDKQNRMEIRRVELLKEGDRTDYIRSGIKPGETVITRHALLVYNNMK